MSDGLKFVRAILSKGSRDQFLLAPDELFLENEVDVFYFARDHFWTYGTLPALETLETELGLRLPQAPESVDDYLRRLHDRWMIRKLRASFMELRDALQYGEMERARRVVNTMSSACRMTTPDNDRADRLADQEQTKRKIDARHIPDAERITKALLRDAALARAREAEVARLRTALERETLLHHGAMKRNLKLQRELAARRLPPATREERIAAEQARDARIAAALADDTPLPEWEDLS